MLPLPNSRKSMKKNKCPMENIQFDTYHWLYGINIDIVVSASTNCVTIVSMLAIERTWWRLFQKRVVYTKFDIYVFILVWMISFLYTQKSRTNDHEICIPGFSNKRVELGKRSNNLSWLWILQFIWLIRMEQHWVCLITWVGIVTSPTHSFTNDKFK